ncbi:hypothetical protein EAL2_c09110 [Peptoclostridium acidaminophilum DSM 3953]|uniref:Uncharacterized protein n=1 Tax=Peptoclostridium acidaminophilum DSM 3953 TaxID=1286171 RepID=W8T5U0_PEPAC|nr:hypothetical protein EAL2_c09110 [Peptoclostridium acidaminophilum DSM 3953]
MHIHIISIKVYFVNRKRKQGKLICFWVYKQEDIWVFCHEHVKE